MKRPLASVFRILLFLAVPLFLAACSETYVMNLLTPPQDKSVAEYYIGLFTAGNFGIIERDLDPTMDAGSVNAKLTQAFKLLPHQPPISTRMVGMHVITENGVYNTSFSFEYQYPGAWFLISIATRGKGPDFRITGLTVQQMADSLENINRFTLTGKSIAQYVVLAYIPVVVLFTLYALIACIREKGLKRKWLWIIFILFGVGTFGLNWTTGESFYGLLSIQLFSASAFSAFYSPWLIKVSFPLGALVYLLTRRGKSAATEPAI